MKTQKQNIVPSAELLAPRGVRYYSELADWTPGETETMPDGSHQFSVREKPADGERRDGREIFRVTVDPLLDRSSVFSLKFLLAYSPQLWRWLRDLGRYCTNTDSEEAIRFGEILALLTDTAAHSPYEWPVNNEDESICLEQMERDRMLADPKWRFVMLSSAIEITNDGDMGTRFKCRGCGHIELLPNKMSGHLMHAHGISEHVMWSPATTPAIPVHYLGFSPSDKTKEYFCLMCNHSCGTWHNLVRHMKKKHGVTLEFRKQSPETKPESK